MINNNIITITERKCKKVKDSNILTVADWQEDECNEKKFIKKKRKALLKAEQRKRKNELKDINKLYRNKNSRRDEVRKKRTTTKVLMYFILINCSMVEIYSMIAMYLLSDLSALYSLIGAVVGESISYAIYCCKSFHDTKEEKKHDLEREKWLSESESCDESEEEE